jgi:protocatechuate 3,4-dioxygenase beta subunit
MRVTGWLLSGALVGVLALGGLGLSRAMSPAEKAGGLKSGVDKGALLAAFHPTHVTGADRNTDTCPVCNYPTNPAVQVWINKDDTKNIVTIAETLEKATTANADKKMKAFIVFINPDKASKAEMTQRLDKLAGEAKLKNVALVYLPGPNDEAVGEYHINTNPSIKNTVFVYKARQVDTKFINFVANKQGQEALNAAIKTVVQ